MWQLDSHMQLWNFPGRSYPCNVKCHVVEFCHSRPVYSHPHCLCSHLNPTMSTGGSEQFNHLMESIESTRTQLEQKLAEFKAEVRNGQEKAAASAVHKVRQETPYTFKRKGNQEQFRANQRIDETLIIAETELESVPDTAPSAATIKKARESLAEGRKLLAERQKLIKVADQSDLGWAVVAEYTADELAEDSDNEKRLEKAEKPAERKASKKKLHVPDHHSKRHTQKPILPQQQQMPLEALTQALPPRRPLLSPLQATTSQPDGPCFACSQMGHLRRFCLKLQSTSNTKSWYPPSVDTVDVCVTESCIDESSLGCMYLGQFMHTPYVDEDKTCTCSNGECVFN